MKTGPSMLEEDDGKILTTSSIISLHTQALNHPAIILSKVHLSCSVASGLVMIDIRSCMHRIGLHDNANCIFGAIKTAQHVLKCHIIEIRGLEVISELLIVDKDFCNWIDNNKLPEF